MKKYFLPLLTFFIITVLSFSIAYGNDGFNSNAPDLERLSDDVHYLAADELEGRLAGSPGAELAAEYIADVFSSLDLIPADFSDNDYFQEFEIATEVSLGEQNVFEISTPDETFSIKPGQGFTPLTQSSNGSVDGAVVFAGYGITAPEFEWDDYAGIDVTGKIVFCLSGEPKQDDPECVFNGLSPTPYSAINAKVINASNHGAVALIFVTGPANMGEGDEDEFWFFSKVIEFGQSPIPVIQVSQETAGILWSAMPAPLEMYQAEMDRNMMPFASDLENVTVSLATDLERITKTTWNVAGILPGTDPLLRDEYLIIGAHYDHIGWGEFDSRYEGAEPQIHNGADDNASGVAGVLELARLFASSPEKPSRSILFISFSAEEMGLLGSNAYIENPLVPIENTTAMINMDMIGRVSEIDENLVCMVHSIGSCGLWGGMVPEFTPDECVKLLTSEDPFGGSDYIPFYNAKVPVLNFFTGIHDDYNRPTDDADRINYEGMVSVLTAIYEIAWVVTECPNQLEFQESEQVAADPDDEQHAGPSYSVYLGTVPDFAHTDGGFWISDVNEGSPAEIAGLMGGDQILSLGEFVVTDIISYTEALGKFEPGDTVDVTILRDDEEIVLEVTFTARD